MTERRNPRLAMQSGPMQAARISPEASLDSIGTTASTREQSRDCVFFFGQKFKDSGRIRECRYCKQQDEEANGQRVPYQGPRYAYTHRTVNTVLRAHIEKHHRTLYISLLEEHKWVNRLPASTQVSGLPQAIPTPMESTPPQVPLSTDTTLEYILKFIVGTEQPLSVIDNQQFRGLLTLFRPRFDEDMPHRTTIQTAIVESWMLWFESLKETLKSSLGNVSFTMVRSSDYSGASFVCITAHYTIYDKPATQESITLKSSMLAFHGLQGEYSDANIANTITDLLRRAGIDHRKARLFYSIDECWTVDSISNNIGFVEALHAEHRPDIPMQLIPCFPQVISLVSECVIKALSGGTGDDNDDDIDNNTQVPTSLLSKVRGLIRAIRDSDQQEAFRANIIKGNELQHWTDKDNKVKVKPQNLILDVRTRWDSTYKMLVRLHDLRLPMIEFCQHVDKSYQRITMLALSPIEWKSVASFIAILQFPYSLQEKMSKETTPVLMGAVPGFERLLVGWAKLCIAKPLLAPAINIGLQVAKQHYKRYTAAYVIAMFIHPGIRMSWIIEHWSPAEARKAEHMIKALMKKYEERFGLGSASSVQAELPTHHSGYDTLGISASFDVLGDRGPALSTDQDYNIYIQGAVTNMDIGDILKYWETHAKIHPTVFHIAMDYLPIQASSVPRKQVFCSGTGTGSLRRDRQSPILTEVMQMLKCALNTNGLNFTGGLITPERDLVLRKYPGDLLGSLLSTAQEDGREDIKDSLIREFESY